MSHEISEIDIKIDSNAFIKNLRNLQNQQFLSKIEELLAKNDELGQMLNALKDKCDEHIKICPASSSKTESVPDVFTPSLTPPLHRKPQAMIKGSSRKSSEVKSEAYGSKVEVKDSDSSGDDWTVLERPEIGHTRNIFKPSFKEPRYFMRKNSYKPLDRPFNPVASGSSLASGGGMGGGELILYIYQLDSKTQEEALITYFSKWGDVSDVLIVTDFLTGASRGYGFVMFNAYTSSPLSVKRHSIEGRSVALKSITQKENKHLSSGNCLMSGKLQDMSNTEIQEYFSQYGTIREIRRINYPLTTTTRFAFLEFESVEAVRQMFNHDGLIHKINGKILYVTPAKKRNF